jgi:hypothetical protein
VCEKAKDTAEEIVTTLASATAKTPGTLSGLRVLFVPKNSRTAYFRSFLKVARRQHNWHIDVVSPARDASAWQGIADGFIATPDFTQARPWEKDRSACNALDAFISSCERGSGISAGRILLAGERDLGRGFSWTNFYWFHDETARQAMADNDAPMRILRRIFAFARTTLESSRPDLVLAGEWANPLCFAFYLAARQLGIPCAVNRLSKIWSGKCYWSSAPSMYNEASRAMVEDLRAKDTAVSDHANNRIAEFRNSPATLGYVKQNWNALDQRGWMAEHIELSRMLGAEILHRLQRREGPPPKPALRLLWDLYRRAYLRVRQAPFFRRLSEEELRNKRYIYMAMHKDPEQALNYQAPFWSNQYNTASLLSSVLPDGYSLLVREHRNNRGRRPTRYYKELRRLPGVLLIDGLDDQFKYIRNADLVVTENGSSGWEGLMLGRRIIALDESFYGAAGLARRIPVPEELASVVIEMLKEPPVTDAAAHDRALGWLLDAEWQTTAPIDEPDYRQTLALLSEIVAAAPTQSSHQAALATA